MTDKTQREVLHHHTNISDDVIDRMLRKAEVRRMSGLPTTTMYDYIRGGLFPKPYKVGRISLWKLSEIEEWMTNLQRAQ